MNLVARAIGTSHLGFQQSAGESGTQLLHRFIGIGRTVESRQMECSNGSQTRAKLLTDMPTDNKRGICSISQQASIVKPSHAISSPILQVRRGPLVEVELRLGQNRGPVTDATLHNPSEKSNSLFFCPSA